MTPQKKIDPLNLIIGFLVVILLAFIGYIGNLFFNKTFKQDLVSLPKITLPQLAVNNTTPTTPNQVTQVTGLSGIISSKSISSISLPSPISPSEKINVSINEKTKFIKLPSSIPYFLTKKNEESISFNDIKVNDLIIVSLSSDSETKIASEIKLVTPDFKTNGLVKSISGNSITIDAASKIVENVKSDEKTYTVTANGNTEITLVGSDQPKKLSVSDIKVGQYIGVYSETPFGGNSISANLITVPYQIPQ